MHIDLVTRPITPVGTTSVSINTLYTIVDHKTTITALISKLSACRPSTLSSYSSRATSVSINHYTLVNYKSAITALLGRPVHITLPYCPVVTPVGETSVSMNILCIIVDH